jgi:hypothetical protein
MTAQTFRWMVVGAISVAVSAVASWAQETADRPLARSAEDRPRIRRAAPSVRLRRPVPVVAAPRGGERRGAPARRPGPPPKPVVIRFKRVPAESFLHVLEQLARVPEVGEALKKLPVAVHEPSNSVVIIAPPEAAEMLMHLAAQLDQPSEFHEFMREREEGERHRRMEREAAERDRDVEMHKRKLELEARKREIEMGARRRAMAARPEMRRRMGMPRVPGRPGPQPVRPGAMMGRPGFAPRRELAKPPQREPREPEPPHRPRRESEPPHRPREEPKPPREPGPEARTKEMVGRLLSPEGIERLRLEKPQIKAIHQALAEHKERVMHLRERIERAMREMDPRERKEAARHLEEKARDHHAELARKLHERIADVLTPDQRHEAERCSTASRATGAPSAGSRPSGTGTARGRSTASTGTAEPLRSPRPD